MTRNPVVQSNLIKFWLSDWFKTGCSKGKKKGFWNPIALLYFDLD